MKKGLITFVCIYLVGTVFSQTTLKLENGKTVILNNDNTWEIKILNNRNIQFGMPNIVDGKFSLFSIDKIEIVKLDPKKTNEIIKGHYIDYKLNSVAIIKVNIINNSADDMNDIRNDFQFKYPEVQIDNMYFSELNYLKINGIEKILNKRNIEGFDNGEIVFILLWNSDFNINNLAIRYKKSGTTKASMFYRSEWYNVEELVSQIN
jgi:hypothetical protein